MNKTKSYNSPLLDQMFDEISEKDLKKTERRMKLAVKIADAMRANGYSKTQLAKVMNQHASVITKWLSGTHNFTIDTLFELEGALNLKLISVDDDTADVRNKIIYQTVVLKQTTPFIEDFSLINFSPNGLSFSYTVN